MKQIKESCHVNLWQGSFFVCAVCRLFWGILHRGVTYDGWAVEEI